MYIVKKLPRKKRQNALVKFLLKEYGVVASGRVCAQAVRQACFVQMTGRLTFPPLSNGFPTVSHGWAPCQ